MDYIFFWKLLTLVASQIFVKLISKLEITLICTISANCPVHPRCCNFPNKPKLSLGPSSLKFSLFAPGFKYALSGKSSRGVPANNGGENLIAFFFVLFAHTGCLASSIIIIIVTTMGKKGHNTGKMLRSEGHHFPPGWGISGKFLCGFDLARKNEEADFHPSKKSRITRHSTTINIIIIFPSACVYHS